MSWTRINTGLPAGAWVRALAISGSHLFAVTERSGVYVSSDQGKNWRAINDGLPSDALTLAIATSGSNVFVGTRSQGVFAGNGFIPGIANFSSASFDGAALASESIATAMGEGLPEATEVATTVPLPINLAGAQVKVKDSLSVERLAPLFFVSPTQINYQIQPSAPELKE
jgi:hypothetical protein